MSNKIMNPVYAEEFNCELPYATHGSCDHWDVVSHQFYLRRKNKENTLMFFALLIWFIWPMFCLMIYVGM